MSAKLEHALDRLNRVLPLKQRQDSCHETIKRLHQRILSSFVDHGRMLTLEDMTSHVSDIEEAIDTLKQQDMVVFSADGQPVGAYPFTTEQREHRVRINDTHEVHAMCALDALAIGPMFGVNTEINSRCRVTGEPIHIRQSGLVVEILKLAGDIRVGIAWGAATGNACVADSLCMEMIFLKDSATADAWLSSEPDQRETFSLQEALLFADRFFSPLLT